MKPAKTTIMARVSKTNFFSDCKKKTLFFVVYLDVYLVYNTFKITFLLWYSYGT